MMWGNMAMGVAVVIKQDVKRVKAWLYSIPITEQAIINLEYAIEDLETKLENPPSYIISGVGNYSGMSYSGGEEGGSKQQSYAEWVQMSEERLDFLRDRLKRHRRKVDQYYNTMELLKKEPKWGYEAGEILRKKYYDKVKPDRAIYTMFLFCSEESFYRSHRRGIQYFYDILPDVFLKS
jgi:hypothetical protein